MVFSVFENDLFLRIQDNVLCFCRVDAFVERMLRKKEDCLQTICNHFRISQDVSLTTNVSLLDKFLKVLTGVWEFEKQKPSMGRDTLPR